MSSRSELAPKPNSASGVLGRTKNSVASAYEYDAGANPFKMPSDEEVFVLRDEERKKKKLEREAQRDLKVFEKTTWSSRLASTKMKLDDPMDDLAATLPPEEASLLGSPTRRSTGFLPDIRAGSSGNSVGAGGGLNNTNGGDRSAKEKENMADFIAKKREMFLVQMSLDNKREEIRKLEQKADARLRKLREDEALLGENAQKFDDFLKDNDMKAVEAMKRAEQETKLKADKLQEIKKLNAQIAAIKSDMSKYEEQLEDCRKYKDFLVKLTPEEWFEQQREERRQRKEARIAARKAEREAKLKTLKDAADAASALAAAAAAAETERLAKEKKAGRRSLSQQSKSSQQDPMASSGPVGPSPAQLLAAANAAAAVYAAAVAAPEPVDDGEGAEAANESEDDYPMYFVRPEQLIEIFQRLEENNLFLIQNCQETEETLDELRQDYESTRRRMDGEVTALKTQIEMVDHKIQEEEDKTRALEDRSGGSGIGGEGQEKLLKELTAKVAEVYVKSGFDNEASISILQMLTNIEARLEELLSLITTMPKDYVEAAEKSKEKERRQRVRTERMEQQKKIQEERIKRALERSQAPVTKKTGKPLMFRSTPAEPKKEKRVEDEDEEPSNADDVQEFFM